MSETIIITIIHEVQLTVDELSIIICTVARGKNQRSLVNRSERNKIECYILFLTIKFPLKSI